MMNGTTQVTISVAETGDEVTLSFEGLRLMLGALLGNYEATAFEVQGMMEGLEADLEAEEPGVIRMTPDGTEVLIQRADA